MSAGVVVVEEFIVAFAYDLDRSLEHDEQAVQWRDHVSLYFGFLIIKNNVFPT